MAELAYDNLNQMTQACQEIIGGNVAWFGQREEAEALAADMLGAARKEIKQQDALLDNPALPQKGSILNCLFPYKEKPGKPGEKLHPALVLDISFPSGSDCPVITVAMGTSNMSPQEDGKPFLPIETIRDQKESGLSKQTTFMMGRVRVLPYNKSWFPQMENGKVEWGRLKGHLAEQMEDAWKEAMSPKPSARSRSGRDNAPNGHRARREAEQRS